MAMKRWVKISREIWARLRKHTLAACVLYLYLVDNPTDTLAGIIELDYDMFNFLRPGIDGGEYDAALQALSDDGLIELDGAYVKVCNYVDWQGNTGAKVQIALQRELDALRGKTSLVDGGEAEPVAPHVATAQPALPALAPAPDARAAYLAVAEMCSKMLHERVRQSEHTDKRLVMVHDRNGAALATGMAGSKLPPDELRAAWEWALDKQPARLLNMIPYTLQNGAAWAKLCNARATAWEPGKPYAQPEYKPTRPPREPAPPLPAWTQNLPKGAILVDTGVLVGDYEIPTATAAAWWADGKRDDLPPEAHNMADDIQDVRTVVTAQGLAGLFRQRAQEALGEVKE